MACSIILGNNIYFIISYLIAFVLAIRYHIDMRRENPESIIGKQIRNKSKNYYGKYDFIDANMITLLLVLVAPLTVILLGTLLISYGIYWIIFEKLLKLKFKK